MVWLLTALGFRYSYTRDAYILRGVGKRFGPVFVERPSSNGVAVTQRSGTGVR